MSIHPTAVIEEGAELGEDVIIEPYVIIKKNVKLGARVKVKAHAYIEGYTSVGEDTEIAAGASIGAPPQAFRYKGEQTFVNIGKNCIIREYVTINSSIGEGASVEIGDNCMLMAYCHVAHNCKVGNNVIMSNNAGLAGHVIVEDHAILGGMAAVHQFVRIGSYAMVGGLSRVPQDVLPYTLGAGAPYRLGGLNLVGLKRHGFCLKTRQTLSHAFRLLYRSKLKTKDALKRIEDELEPIPEILHWLEFCRATERGLIGMGGVTKI